MSEKFTEGVGPSFEICVACGQTVGDKLSLTQGRMIPTIIRVG